MIFLNLPVNHPVLTDGASMDWIPRDCVPSLKKIIPQKNQFVKRAIPPQPYGWGLLARRR